MSTRGAFGFRIDGVDKVTYNHWDSYPEGLGEAVVFGLSSMLGGIGYADMVDRVRALRVVDPESKPTAEEQRALEQYADTAVASGRLDDWYVLLRKTQGDLVATVESGVVLDAADFLLDSLFCEYAYIIDLDTGHLELYRGFNKDPDANGRYASKRGVLESRVFGNEHYGVALVAKFPIAEIPADWAEVFSEEEDGDGEEAA